MADPQNDLKNREYNAEPGIIIVPGSKYQQYMTQFEQFQSKLTAGDAPGNPYVYRPFPKMLYRAEHWEGVPKCMAAAPDSYLFKDPREFERAEVTAQKFTERCQRIVNNEAEMRRAMEDGWRESPAEAVEYLRARDSAKSTAAAELNHADRNLSEPAKRERAEALAEAHARGEHLAEVPEKRRGRPRKVVQA
jgi:hypothetical protein